MKVRSAYLDIIKAIGIISIVIGHSCWTVATSFGELMPGPFVYLYHIMLFMFCGGYCYNDKYTQSPFEFIGKRIGSTLPLFFGYNVLFILMHNHLLDLRMIAGEVYTLRDIMVRMLIGTTYESSETLLGAFWFIPMYVLAMGLFCINEYVFSRCRRAKWSIIGVILLGSIGIWLNWNQLPVSNYHIHTALLAVPVIWVGQQIRKFWERVYRYLHWSGILVAGAILCLVCHSHIGIVELSVCQIIHPVLFYPVTFVGIYMCLGIAKYIERWNLFSRIMAVIGKNSFHIMALHFLVFKIVDKIYSMTTKASMIDMSAFPHSYDLPWICIIVGVLFPVVLVEGIRKLWGRMQFLLRH